MVQYCSAYNCKTIPIPGDGISFHVFPKDENLWIQWCLAVRRSNFIPSQHSRLCSKHFTEEDFLKNKCRRYLKPGAIPSIFDFPENTGSTQKALLKRQRSPTSQTESDTSTDMNEDLCNKKKSPLVIYLRQHN